MQQARLTERLDGRRFEPAPVRDEKGERDRLRVGIGDVPRDGPSDVPLHAEREPVERALGGREKHNPVGRLDAQRRHDALPAQVRAVVEVGRVAPRGRREKRARKPHAVADVEGGVDRRCRRRTAPRGRPRHVQRHLHETARRATDGAPLRRVRPGREPDAPLAPHGDARDARPERDRRRSVGAAPADGRGLGARCGRRGVETVRTGRLERGETRRSEPARPAEHDCGDGEPAQRHHPAT